MGYYPAMHARPTPFPFALSVGLHRAFLMILVFGFALAMGALAVEGPGPRTVQFNFPDASNVQTGPTSTGVPSPR